MLNQLKLAHGKLLHPCLQTNRKGGAFAVNSKHDPKLGSGSIKDPDEIAPMELSGSQGGSALGIHKRKQGYDSSPLDGVGEIALLLGSQTGEAAGQDLAPFGDEALEQIDIFVVDRITGLDR